MIWQHRILLERFGWHGPGLLHPGNEDSDGDGAKVSLSRHVTVDCLLAFLTLWNVTSIACLGTL